MIARALQQFAILLMLYAGVERLVIIVDPVTTSWMSSSEAHTLMVVALGIGIVGTLVDATQSLADTLEPKGE